MSRERDVKSEIVRRVELDRIGLDGMGWDGSGRVGSVVVNCACNSSVASGK